MSKQSADDRLTASSQEFSPPSDSALEGDQSAYTRAMDAIDFEIRLAQARQRGQGWTASAVTLATAPLLWMIVQRLSNSDLHIDSVCVLFLAYSTVLFVIKILHIELTGSTLAQHTHVRIRSGIHDMAASRAAMAVIGVWCASLWHIARTTEAQIGPVAQWILMILYGAMAVVCLAVLIMSYTTMPLVYGARKDRSWAGSTTLAVFLSYSAYNLFAASPIIHTPTSLVSHEVALLSVGILALLVVLSFSTTHDSRVSELVLLRRSIVSSKTDPRLALVNLDIILHGFTVDRFLAKRIEPLVQVCDQLSASLTSRNNRIAAISEWLSTAPSSDDSGYAVAASAIDGVSSNGQDVLMRELDQGIAKLEDDRRMLRRNGVADAEIDRSIATFRSAHNQVRQLREQGEHVIASLKKRLGTPPSE